MKKTIKDYQEEIDKSKQKIEKKVRRFKDKSEEVQIFLQEQLQNETVEEIKNIYATVLGALQEADASISDIPKLSLSAKTEDLQNDIQNKINDIFSNVKTTFRNSQKQARAIAPDLNLMKLIKDFVNTSNMKNLKIGVQNAIAKINEQSKHIEQLKFNVFEFNSDFSPYNVTSHPRLQKYDVDPLISLLKQYNKEFEDLQNETQTSHITLDEDLLSPARKILRSVEYINTDIKKVKEQVEQFKESDKKDDVDLIEYVKGLRETVDEINRQVRKNINSSPQQKLADQFTETSNSLQEVLKFDYNNLLRNLRDYGNYDNLPRSVRDELDNFSEDTSKILELHYSLIENEVRNIDHISGTSSELPIHQDIRLQGEQIRSRLYQEYVSPDGERYWGDLKYFDKPLEGEIESQVMKLSISTAFADKVSSNLMGDRLAHSSVADFAQQQLSGTGLRSNLFNRNRDYQRSLYESQRHLARGMEIYQKTLATQDTATSNKALDNIGEIFSNVSQQQIKLANSFNTIGSLVSGLSKSDQTVVEEYTKNITHLIDNYNVLIDAMEQVNPNSDVLQRLKNERKELFDTRQRLNDISTINVSFKKALKDLFDSTKEVILFFSGLTAVAFGGSTLLDFINPLKALQNAINKINQQGTMRQAIAKTDIAHGAGLNQSHIDDLSYYQSQKLYEQTYGKIDFTAVSQTYINLFNSVGGQYNSSPQQNMQDMHKFAVELTPMRELKGVSDSTINMTLKTFYKDLGLSSNEALKKFKEMETMAIQNNTSMDYFANIVAPLAATYRNFGLSEERAYNVIMGLLKDHSLLIEDATSLARSTGKAVANWHGGKQSNWAKNVFFNSITGDGLVSTAIEDSLISVDRFGKVNEKFYDRMFDNLWAQVSFFGTDSNIGMVKFAEGLKENGYGETDISIALSMAKEGRIDELRQKLKGMAEFNSKSTKDITNDYVSALHESAEQIAETEKIEAKYASSINHIAKILHDAFGSSVSKFVKWIKEKVEEFIDKFSSIFNWFGGTKVGKEVIKFSKEHPFAAILGLYVTKNLAMWGGGKVLKALANLPARLLTSTPKGVERSAVSNVVNAFEGVSANKKAAIIASILAGGMTLADAISDYADFKEKNKEKDFFAFLTSGEAKVQLIKEPKHSDESMLGTFLSTAFVVATAYSMLRKGKMPSARTTSQISRQSNSIFQRAKNFFTGNSAPSVSTSLPPRKMSSSQRRDYYNQRRETQQRINARVNTTSRPAVSAPPSSWRTTGGILGRNILFSTAFEAHESYSTGTEFSFKDVAVDAAKFTIGETVGSAVLGNVAKVAAGFLKIRNADKFVNTARNIGGFGGIMAINSPGLLNAMSSTAEASETEPQFEQHENQYQYLLKQQNLAMAPRYVPVPVKRKDKDKEQSQTGLIMTDEEGKAFVSKHTGIDNRVSEIPIAKASTYAQSEAFGNAALKLGLSNREFESIVAASLYNHGMDWQNMNDEQKDYWFKKYQEYLKLYGDNQYAIMMASQAAAKNPLADSGMIKKQIAEQLEKEWESSDEVKGKWFERMSKNEQYTQNQRDRFELIANYYYHSQEDPNDENSFWAKQLEIYKYQVSQGQDLNPAFKGAFASWKNRDVSNLLFNWSDISDLTAKDLKEIAKLAAERDYKLGHHEYIAVMGEERWKEQEAKLKAGIQSNVGAPSKYGTLNGVETNTLSGDALQIAKTQHPEIYNLILKYSKQYNVDPRLVAAIIKNESGFKVGDLSDAGAGGLMQLMPDTAASLGVTDIYDPDQNIMGGTKYLASLLNRFNGDVQTAIAAYNAGPNGDDIAEFQKSHDQSVLCAETRSYLNNVLSSIGPEDGSYQPVNSPSPVPSSVDATRSVLGGQTDPEGNPIRFTQLADGTLVPLYGQYWDGGTYDRLSGQGDSMAASACGPTSLAMALSNITGRFITPREIADWSTKMGFHEGFGMSHAAFEAARQQYGVGFRRGTKEEAMQALRNNMPVVVGVIDDGTGTFTRNSHFITYAGLRSDGSVIVHDPNDNHLHYVDERISDSTVWRDEYDYWIPDEVKKGASQFGAGSPITGTRGASAPVSMTNKTAKEQLNDLNAHMAAISKKGAGVIASGDLVNGMWVDPSKKVRTQEDKKKAVLEQHGLSYNSIGEQQKKDISAQLGQAEDKLNEIRETIKNFPELLPKKHFKEALKIVREIAEKYMDDVEISADCVIT